MRSWNVTIAIPQDKLYVLRVWVIQKEMQIVRHMHELQYDWKSYGSSSLLSYFHATPTLQIQNYILYHFHEKKREMSWGTHVMPERVIPCNAKNLLF